MTHKEELFILACAVGKCTQVADADTALAAAYALANTVTKEDVAEADALAKGHIMNCNCAICTMAKAELAKREADDESFAV